MEAREYPTSNQERQMWCVQHHTELPTNKDVDVDNVLVETTPTSELYLPGPVGNSVAYTWLKTNGFCVLANDGIKITYM